MKPYSINLVNALTLVVLGSWAYFASENPSATALIPVFTGILLLTITPGFKKGNRIMAHIAVLLTLVILIGLVKPLTGAIGRTDLLGTGRVIVMMCTSFLALVIFIRSFISARKSS